MTDEQEQTRRQFLVQAGALGVGGLLVPATASSASALAAETGGRAAPIRDLLRRAGNAEDEKTRYRLLKKLSDQPDLDSQLRDELDELLPIIHQWAFGREEALARLDEKNTHRYLRFFNRKINPENNYPPRPQTRSPLYPIWALYRSRMLIWFVMDHNYIAEEGPESRGPWYGRARTLLREAQEAFPENRIISMYLGTDLPWPASRALQPDPQAPRWANLQREGLEKMTGVIHWWIDERQLPNGEYGGGWNDDCEMWRWQAPVLVGFEDPKLNEAQARFSRGMFDLPRMDAGYMGSEDDIIDDVQHSSEYSCDTITPMMHLRPEAQVWKQRALQLTNLMRSLWAGRNERGFLQFKSAFLNADEIDERPRHACDTLCHTRVTQPTLLLWQRTGDEALGELFTDWMDTWVDATARAERGKPAGVVPPAIHWPDGHVGGVGDQWWYPEIFPDREVSSPFTWPGKMSNMLNTLLLTADMTGDEKYVEPIRSMARVWEKHAGRSTSEHPEPGSEAWCAQRMEDFLPAVLAKYRVLAGDTQFDALWRSDADGYASYRFAGDRQALEEGLTENAEAFRKNFPAFTSEVCYTDRVLSFDSNYQKYYASEPLPRSRPGLLYSAVTGDPGGAGYFPMNAVRWLTEPREIAALVTEAGEERFAAELYHFGEEPREMGARFYLLSPGTYEATLERAADGSTVEQRSMTVEGLSSQTAFELPARELCRLRVRPR